MPTIIFNTDFLSSFLKIGRCDLVRSFYRVEQAFIPTSVHRELTQTDLLTSLLTIHWIDAPSVEPLSDEILFMVQVIQDLDDKDFTSPSSKSVICCWNKPSYRHAAGRDHP